MVQMTCILVEIMVICIQGFVEMQFSKHILVVAFEIFVFHIAQNFNVSGQSLEHTQKYKVHSHSW